MEELPDRFVDQDLNEKQQRLVQLLCQYDEPDTPLGELEDQTPWSRKTCKKWLDRLEARGLVRSRQLPGQETWMYGLAHPRSAYAVPGDLDLARLTAAEDAVRKVAGHATISFFLMGTLLLFIIAEVIAGMTPAYFQFEANDTIVLAMMVLAATGGLWFIVDAVEDIADDPLGIEERLYALFGR